jgi:hypothetical protein
LRVRVEGYALFCMRATHFFVKGKGGEVKAGLGLGSGLRLVLRLGLGLRLGLKVRVEG